jgi:o-succinylbenzoate---CoA ligase
LSVVARQLSVVPAPAAGPEVLATVEPAMRACLDGGSPLAVLPAGPPAAVDAARALLRPEIPLEEGADLVVVTSGSTGAGRGVLLSAAALRASGEATLDRLGGPGDWLLALPVSAIAGLQVFCRSALTGRRPTVLAQGESLTDAVARMPAGRRYTALVPTQLRRSLDAEPGSLRAFDAVLVGGAATDPALLDRARAGGVPVVTTYGMTETAGGCVYDGWHLDGTQVRLDSDGSIELTGPTLATGYLDDPKATAHSFHGGWFRTCDLGRLDTQGRLQVLGRADDMIVTGGLNVAPGDVEAVLTGLPGVAAACVVGVPDPEWGERVTAAVIPADPGHPPDPGALRAAAHHLLTGAQVPKEIVLFDALPLRGVGKPDRRAVRSILTARTR